MAGFHGSGPPNPHSCNPTHNIIGAHAVHTDAFDPQHAMPLPLFNFGGTRDAGRHMITGAAGRRACERTPRDNNTLSPIVAQSMDRPHHLFWPIMDNFGRIVTKTEQSTEITSCDLPMPDTASNNILESMLRSTLTTSECNIAKFCKNIIEEEENVHSEEDSRLRKKKRLTGEQLRTLEGSFEVDRKLEAERKQELAQRLGLEPRQIAIWFQNRRARSKTKHLEHDYALLKAQYKTVLTETMKLRAEVTRLTAELEAATSKGSEEALVKVKPTGEVEDGAQQQEGAINVTLISNAKKVVMASSPSICCSTGSGTEDHYNDDHNIGSLAANGINDGDGGSSTSPISSVCGCQVPYSDECLASHDLPSTTYNEEHTIPSNFSSCGAQPLYNTTIKSGIKECMSSLKQSISFLKHLPNSNSLPSCYSETSSCRHVLHLHSSSCASQPPYTQHSTIERLPSHFNRTFNDGPTNNSNTAANISGAPFTKLTTSLYLNPSSSQPPYTQHSTIEHLPCNSNHTFSARPTHLLDSPNTTSSISSAPNNKSTTSHSLNHSDLGLVPVLDNPHETIAIHQQQVPFSNYDDGFFSQSYNKMGVECIWQLTNMS